MNPWSKVDRIGAVRKVGALSLVFFQGFIPSPLRCWVGRWAEAAWGAGPGFVLQREADSCTGAFAWRGVVSAPERPRVPAELATAGSSFCMSGPPNDQHSHSPVLLPSPSNYILSLRWIPWMGWWLPHVCFWLALELGFLLDILPGTGT